MSSRRGSVSARAGSKSASAFDYDLLIIGCGVGGHGAALHAIDCGLKVAILEGHDIGGTCVNRGCVPSKALLAASGRVRELKHDAHLKQLGIHLPKGEVTYDRQAIADHAKNLANNIQGNLARSLEAIGCEILRGSAKLVGPHTVSYGLPGRVDVGGTVTAKDIIIATGSVPFVPPGITIDGKTVFTSDHALKMEWVPDWVGIIGSGYIGLEFSDVYTALGSEVTFIEAMPMIMPGFDREVARVAERTLITPRKIDYKTNVLATKVTPGIPGVKPVEVTLCDFNTKEVVEVMELDAVMVATGRAPYTTGLNLKAVGCATDRRGFVPVDDHMRVLDPNGKAVEGLWCIGDANGRLMLAHAASAQGIAVVETIKGRSRKVNHNAIPAACFTHPEVSFVGMTEEQARDKAEKEGFKDQVAVAKTQFKANSKALAELESDGLCKLIYRKDTGEILGCWIFGIHSPDMIHELSAAMNMGDTVQDIKFNVHAHPTLAEVLEEVIRHAKVEEGAKAKATVGAH